MKPQARYFASLPYTLVYRQTGLLVVCVGVPCLTIYKYLFQTSNLVVVSANLKKLLLDACRSEIDKRKASVQTRLDMITESRNDETKSSAGDKYETGRAMMQIEESKAQAQLQEVLAVERILKSLNPESEYSSGQLGSVVETDKGKFYLSIGVGKVRVEGNTVYCVSMESPIGKLLTGRAEGDIITFRESEYHVMSIS